MGTFVISKKHNDEYKFVYTSRKGKIVFSSFGYELKMYAEEDIDFIKENIEYVECLKFKSSNGKYFYKLVINEKVYATSRKFSTELRFAKGIEEVYKYVAQSEILDFSGVSIFDEENI